MLLQQSHVHEAIRVGLQDESARIAALCDMMRGIDRDHTGKTGHMLEVAAQAGISQKTGKRSVCPRI